MGRRAARLWACGGSGDDRDSRHPGHFVCEYWAGSLSSYSVGRAGIILLVGAYSLPPTSRCSCGRDFIATPAKLIRHPMRLDYQHLYRRWDVLITMIRAFVAIEVPAHFVLEYDIVDNP